jgi:excisionase family DNA binding protein
VLSLDNDSLDLLAVLVEQRLSGRWGQPGRSPWMTAAEAADYLRCPVSRVRKLTMTRELPCHRDGRRVLYSTHELDDFIRRGGARSP